MRVIFRNPPKSGVSGQLHRCNWPVHHRFNRCMHLPCSSSAIAPTYSIFPSSVHSVLNPSLSFWVHCTNAFTLSIVDSSGACSWLGLLWAHCTDECNLPSAGSTGDSKLPLSWSFRPDFFGVLYLFILWSYKPDNDHLNTHFNPSVVCVIKHQDIILKYGMRGHFCYRAVWSSQGFPL